MINTKSRLLKPVHQYHSVVNERDGLGNNVLALQRMFREMGYESEVFYDFCSESLADKLRPWADYKNFSDTETILVVHYSIDHPNLDILNELTDRVVFSYHNITPAKFFEPVTFSVAEECRRGRTKLPSFKNRVACTVGSNNFNLSELELMGFRKNFHIPELIDFKQYNKTPNQVLVDKLNADETITWLFVGRIVPNKRQDNIIRIFFYYQKYINPQSRLIFVGSWDGMQLYKKYLQDLTKLLGVSNVLFTGSIPQEDLIAYYISADLFLCMSEHEGLCIPLVEAMVFGLPIIAFDSSAIRDTLGTGGILIRDKRFPEIAELAHYFIENLPMKKALALNQKTRLNDFSEAKIRKGWQEVLNYVHSL